MLSSGFLCWGAIVQEGDITKSFLPGLCTVERIVVWIQGVPKLSVLSAKADSQFCCVCVTIRRADRSIAWFFAAGATI